MENAQPPKKKSGTVQIVIGVLLILGILSGGNLASIGNWSSSEMVGYNVFAIVALVGGAYLIRVGMRRNQAK